MTTRTFTYSHSHIKPKNEEINGQFINNGGKPIKSGSL